GKEREERIVVDITVELPGAEAGTGDDRALAVAALARRDRARFDKIDHPVRDDIREYLQVFFVRTVRRDRVVYAAVLHRHHAPVFYEGRRVPADVRQRPVI